MTVGERIKILRNIRGLTQKELAEACGISLRTIGRIENDYADKYLKQVHKISKELGVNYNFILCTNTNGSVGGPFNLYEYKKILSEIKNEFAPSSSMSPIRLKSIGVSVETIRYAIATIKRLIDEEHKVVDFEFTTMTSSINERSAYEFFIYMDKCYNFLSDIHERMYKLQKMIVKDLKQKGI